MRISRRDYSDPLYKTWRQQVRARDKCKCQWPGCKARKKLVVHHIKRWADIPSLRYSVQNGITLCKVHHDSVKDKEQAYESFFYNIILQQKCK